MNYVPPKDGPVGRKLIIIFATIGLIILTGLFFVAAASIGIFGFFMMIGIIAFWFFYVNHVIFKSS